MSRACAPGVPRVTVLLPVHDGGANLEPAVDSILRQSFRDFELLLIDDGSRDGSIEGIAEREDPRVRLVRQERNLGLIETLNRGLDLARGEIVARMDADDVSLPQRLRRQIDFLDAHPAVGACGSWIRTFGDRPERTETLPTDPDDIRCRMLFAPQLAHPTVCLRREWFARHGLRFDARFPHAEDYDLWRRASEHFPLANVGEVLLRYRTHPDSVTRRHRRIQIASAERIHRELLLALGLSPSTQQLALHRGGSPDEPEPPLADTEDWLCGLLRANRVQRRYPERALERAVARRWRQSAVRAIARGQRVHGALLRSPLAKHLPIAGRLRLSARAVARSLMSASSASEREVAGR